MVPTSGGKVKSQGALYFVQVDFRSVSLFHLHGHSFNELLEFAKVELTAAEDGEFSNLVRVGSFKIE